MMAQLKHFAGGLGIRTQVIVLLVTTQLLTHAGSVGFMLYHSSDPGRISEIVGDVSDPMLTVLRLVGNDASNIDKLVREDSRFILSDHVPTRPLLPEIDALLAANLPTNAITDVFAFELSDHSEWPLSPRISPFGLVSPIPDGRWLVFTPYPSFFLRTAPWIVSSMILSLFVVPLMLLSIWAGAWIVAPISRLSTATDAFSRDIYAPDMPEEGPREVRKAIGIFNKMQRSLRRLIDDRSRTLASIGHDMRTPLTRLRLRLETVPLCGASDAVERDLATLERMIDDALRFMRSDHHKVDIKNVDLPALCQTAADAFQDQGYSISMNPSGRVTVACDLILTMRVLDNILGNAVNHADGAKITIQSDAKSGCAKVIITDTGPGIPAHLMEFVQQPFNRIPNATGQDGGDGSSFGLGLSIASELMARQSGSMELAANTPSGLKVTLTLKMPKEAV